MRRHDFDVPGLPGIAVGLVSVPDDQDLHLDLRVEAVSEGVLVTGTVHAVAEGECGRCLEPVTLDLEVPIQELWYYPDRAPEAGPDDEEDVLVLADDLLDLEPVVRDEIVLALPLQPVCRPDCQGLCPDCGVRLDDVDEDHHHDVVDPRWAALTRIDETGGRRSTPDEE